MPFRRMPPLTALKAFEAAARHNSFKKAAKEMNVTPAAISQQVRALEAEIGVVLFDRGVRSVSLTHQGDILSESLTDIFHDMRKAVERVSPEHENRLRIGCPPAIAVKWLAPRMSVMSESVPGVSLEFRPSEYLATLNNDIDFSLCFTEKPDGNYFFYPICSEFMVPMCSPKLRDQLDLKTPADVMRAPLIHDHSLRGMENTPIWTDWLKLVGVDRGEAARGLHFEQSADQALEAAVAGAGVVFSRLSLAFYDVMDGRLVCPFGTPIRLKQSYYLVCHEGRQKERAMRQMIEYFKVTVAGANAWAKENVIYDQKSLIHYDDLMPVEQMRNVG